MTAGSGILHIETPPEELVISGGRFHGLQLWVALPDAYRWTDPGFEHHADLPRFTGEGMIGTVLVGNLGGVVSPATARSPKPAPVS